MKMKLTFLLFAVTVFSLTAQTNPIVEVLLNNATENVSASVSQNGTKWIIAQDYYTNPSTNVNHLGLVKTITTDANYHPVPLSQYQLEKGTEGSDPTVIIYSSGTCISNNGDVYIFYRKDAYGGDIYDVLNKNGVVVGSYTNKGIYSLKSNNNDLFILLRSNGNTQSELSKIDASTNNVEWTITQSGDLGRKILLNNGNPFMKMQSGNLVEYNSSNGTVVATTTTDDPNDIFQLTTTDYIEKLDKSDKKLYTETGTTEWEYRFWLDNVGGGIWKKIGHYTYVVTGTKLFVFDEDMEDVYDILISYLNSNETLLASYIYDNKSVTYITRIDETIYYKHFDFPTVDVPIINSSAPNVVAAHNEQIFDGTNWINSNSFISTVVMNDADLPSVGDNVDTNLVTPPSGYTLLTANGFAPSLNSEGYAEYIFHIGTSNVYYIRIKLFFKGTSALGIEDNSISTNIIVSPNPCKNTIKLSNISDINEITVFDNLGQLIFKTQRNNKSNDYLLDITNFKSGLYIIQLKSEKVTLNKKIIKL